MHWGQIKALLIVSFLVLNIYLLLQVMEKKEHADIGILEQQPSTIEERLQAEFITYNDLPQEQAEETYISVNQRTFELDELRKFARYGNQETYFLTKHSLLSTLENPIKLDEGNIEEEIKKTFQDLVYYHDEYTFWNWNEELRVAVFFQNKEKRPVYYNQNGIVLLFLNEKNEVMYYVQTMLGESEPLAEKRNLMEPIRAIETLYEANELSTGDFITKVNIGFHTRVPFETGVQVFAPIWKVTVNDEADYFVNAIEGFIFSSKESEFLEEAIESFLAKTEQAANEEEDLQVIMKDLEKRLQLIQIPG